jgi:hypothetical protein
MHTMAWRRTDKWQRRSTHYSANKLSDPLGMTSDPTSAGSRIASFLPASRRSVPPRGSGAVGPRGDERRVPAGEKGHRWSVLGYSCRQESDRRDRMFSPTDADRDRRADLLDRARLVRAGGWDDYRAVWSTGEVSFKS